jgi:hypothetical protein
VPDDAFILQETDNRFPNRSGDWPTLEVGPSRHGDHQWCQLDPVPARSELLATSPSLVLICSSTPVRRSPMATKLSAAIWMRSV